MEKTFLSKIKETIKFNVKNDKKLLELYSGFTTNQNYPGSVQIIKYGDDCIDQYCYYNNFYFRYDSIHDKVYITFSSDFNMSNFTFDEFFEAGQCLDDTVIQKRFLEFLEELKQLDIIEYELR